MIIFSRIALTFGAFLIIPLIVPAFIYNYARYLNIVGRKYFAIITKKRNVNSSLIWFLFLLFLF